MRALARAAGWAFCALPLVALLLPAACRQRDDPPTGGPPGAAVAPTGPGVRFSVEPAGTFGVKIAAPLETFVARASGAAGWFVVPPDDLARAQGEVLVDLSTLVTRTFGDASDDKQTQHAKEWLGLGGDVPAAVREQNRWARLALVRVLAVSAPRLGEVPEREGVRTVRYTVVGAFRMRGREADKTLELDVAFGGPAAAPTHVQVSTVRPFVVSLVEHDVKPRDALGRFVKGTLESIGRKLDDKALVSASFVAHPAKDAGP